MHTAPAPGPDASPSSAESPPIAAGEPAPPQLPLKPLLPDEIVFDEAERLNLHLLTAEQVLEQVNPLIFAAWNGGQAAVLARLDLPWPPSANTAYRHTPIKGRGTVVLLSAAGRDYRKAAVAACIEQRAPKLLGGLLAVTLECWMPDRRVRDLGNIEKVLLDALKQPTRPKDVMASVFVDDSQIRDLRLVERGYAPPGRVRVTIRRFQPGAP